jgi:hypothetical protein
MVVNILNRVHYPIIIDKYRFEPFEEITIRIDSNELFREIRSNRGLRVGKLDNQAYMKRHGLKKGNKINFVYDNMSQHAGEAYIHAIEALSNPIMKHLPKKDIGYSKIPLTRMNIRFFNSARINEQGKAPVGSNDIFFSHGIGDKNYWKGDKIEDYKYAFVPGPAWEKRMRNTGYKGEIFVCGYTKLDPLINIDKNSIKKNSKPKILWAPTHGYHSKNKGRSSYPAFSKYLDQIPNDFEVITSLHPTSKMHNNIKQLPTMEALLEADIIIADAGSTLYEAWILNKPVIFPDWICAKDTMNHFKTDPANFEYQIYSKKIGYHAKDMKGMIKLFDIALSDGMKDLEKEFIEEIYPSKLRGKAGETAAKQILELAEKLKI